MDLMRLEDANLGNFSFLPNLLIEGWHSLVWTERYLDHGDFELKTYFVDETIALLPELRLVCIRESQELMFVEKHIVDEDDEGRRELTIKGRSVTTILENRVIEAPRGQTIPLARDHTDLDAALLYIWNSVINQSGTDVTVPYSGVMTPLTYINNAIVIDSTSNDSGPQTPHVVSAGVVWPYVKGLLQKSYGLRIVRPPVKRSINAVSVSTADDANKGLVVKTTYPSADNLCFDVYNGLDRSDKQSDRIQVIFNYYDGHIQDPKYLFDASDYKTHAFVNTDAQQRLVTQKDPNGAPLGNWGQSGLGLRMIYIDGGDLSADVGTFEFNGVLDNLGYSELNKFRRRRLIESTISPNSPWVYGVHYNLGDWVSVLADFDIDQVMQVQEYTRAQDIEGERAYPTLVNPVI